MKRAYDDLVWFALYYDCNSNKIKQYNVLQCLETTIKYYKKECLTKAEFSKAIRCELMCRYWSKCEWELIIEKDDNDRVWLKPWVGCKNPGDVRIDVTDVKDFDWCRFAEHNIGKQIYKTEAKIDVFDQIEWQWDTFIDYCWYARLKYERDDSKSYNNRIYEEIHEGLRQAIDYEETEKHHGIIKTLWYKPVEDNCKNDKNETIHK